MSRLSRVFVFAGLLAPLLTSRGAQPKDFRFEIFSIRPLNSSGAMPMNTHPSPNGFDSRLSLWQAIMIAYGPVDYVHWGSVEVLKAPAWIGDFYDIKGRVSPADLKAWQAQGSDKELLRAAMRGALKERCNLTLHEQEAKGEIFELRVGKRGSRLKSAGAGSPHPSGLKLPSGGILVQTVQSGLPVKSYYDATTQDLADFLTIMAGGRTPVRDKTGLTGHFDFSIRQTPPSPDENHVYSYPVNQLGLEVKRGVENRPVLVIDHIEKPAPN